MTKFLKTYWWVPLGLLFASYWLADKINENGLFATGFNAIDCLLLAGLVISSFIVYFFLGLAFEFLFEPKTQGSGRRELSEDDLT